MTTCVVVNREVDEGRIFDNFSRNLVGASYKKVIYLSIFSV